MKRFLLAMLLGSMACLSSCSDKQSESVGDAPRIRLQPWSPEVLQAAALIPIQDGGRIKPLGSMAGFLMLSINGKRSYKTHWDEKLDPMSWFLDHIFFPEQAMGYRTIRVVDYRIIESVGLTRRTTKRSDHYSMLEILPAREPLQQQYSIYLKKDVKQRSALEGQIINLAYNMRRLLYLTSFVDFARPGFELEDMPEYQLAFPDLSTLSTLDVLSEWESVREQLASTRAEPSEGTAKALAEADRQLNAANFLSIIPPSLASEETYYSPDYVMRSAMLEGTALGAEMAIVNRFPDLVAERMDMDKLGAGIMDLQQALQGMAAERGEFAKVQEEATYYSRDWFYRAQVVFWLGFLCCLFTWFFSKRGRAWKLLYGGGLALVLTGEVLVISGIVARCILKNRPPVTTVYEAILFIFAAIVLISLFIELIKRNSLALTMAALIGGAGMYVGGWNLETEGIDTIAPLQAVLNTNFWLSIHVPTITLGYAAGLLAAILGHVFIGAKVVDVVRRNAGSAGVSKSFFKEITRMTYGVLCFGALTATVGTILGGVWANDSWGRFWGWDPKENGALLLCLGYLIILHGRMGGYLRQFGIALSSIALGTIVLWAFWGVNLLQIGFHSYGFDATKARITNIYYWTELGVVVFGLAIWAIDRALLLKAKAAK